MAYMNQEKKAVIAASIKPLLKKYGIKGSLSVKHHSEIALTLKSGKIDFIENYNSCNARKHNENRELVVGHLCVNKNYIDERYDGSAKEFLNEALEAMQSAGWYDRSDVWSDYYNVAYYISINIGQWNVPYVVTK